MIDKKVSEDTSQPVPQRRERFFIDTEFVESGPSHPIVLLSIGIVDSSGREFYAVNDQADLTNASDWVKANVLPHLGNFTMSFDGIRRGVLNFVGDCKPEFWGYYSDYDWVAFCQIFGTMMDLPKGWPMYCRDLKQLCVDLGDPKLPQQGTDEHNALNDARWNKKAYEFLMKKTVTESLAAPQPLSTTNLDDDMCELAKRHPQFQKLVSETAAEIRENFGIAYGLGNGKVESLEGDLWSMIHIVAESYRR